MLNIFGGNLKIPKNSINSNWNRYKTTVNHPTSPRDDRGRTGLTTYTFHTVRFSKMLSILVRILKFSKFQKRHSRNYREHSVNKKQYRLQTMQLFDCTNLFWTCHSSGNLVDGLPLAIHNMLSILVDNLNFRNFRNSVPLHQVASVLRPSIYDRFEISWWEV